MYNELNEYFNIGKFLWPRVGTISAGVYYNIYIPLLRLTIRLHSIAIFKLNRAHKHVSLNKQGHEGLKVSIKQQICRKEKRKKKLIDKRSSSG